MRRIGHLCGLAALLGAQAVAAQQPLNLGFETPSVVGPERPWGWSFGWSAFAGGTGATFGLDSLVRHGGMRSLRISVPDSSTAVAPQSIFLQIPADSLRGHQLRLVAWLRSAGRDAAATVTLEAVRGAGETVVADTTALGGNDAVAWTRRQLSIRVPHDETIHSVAIELMFAGRGSVWFDDFELRRDGAPLTTAPLVPLAPNAKQRASLARRTRPLRTVSPPTDAGNPDDRDLEPFAQRVGAARIVALGESTHGTHEFFLLKHRLLEFMVRRLGFSLFAIEANQLAVERINRYVTSGDGTALKAMKALFAVWYTDEVLGLVEWMRRWNQAHPDHPVRFAGYDMQDQRTPADTLRAFLVRAEPSMVARFDTLAGEYRRQPNYATPQIPETTRTRWRDQCETLWSEVRAHRDAWLDRSVSRADTMGVEWAVQSANLLRQAARFNERLSSPERDSLMAANLDWMLRTCASGARAVVWAHDVHVSHGGDPKLSFNAGLQMGATLRHLYGDGYQSFSLLTHDGAYNATRSFTDYRMVAVSAFPAPPNSMEGILHAVPRPAGSPGLFVDLHGAMVDANPGTAWLRVPRPIRHVGYAAYDYGFELRAVTPLEFDGIFFVDHTTASHLR